MHTAYPSGAPTGKPTGFRENTHFHTSEHLPMIPLSQFSFLFGAIVFICLCVPLGFYVYDVRLQDYQLRLKAYETMKKKERISHLSDEEIKRREAMYANFYFF